MTFDDNARYPPGNPSYPTTLTTVVNQAQGADENQQEVREARLLLWESYADPVFCYFYRKLTPFGRQSEAGDLAQDFLIRFFRGSGEERPGLIHYDRSRSRLRTYITRAIDHFLQDEHRRRSAVFRQKVEGDRLSLDRLTEEGQLPSVRGLTIDEIRERYGEEVADAESPVDVFIRVLAIRLGNQALALALEDAHKTCTPENLLRIELILDNLAQGESADLSLDARPEAHGTRNDQSVSDRLSRNHRYVAEQTGTSEGTVKQTWFRFRNKMKQKLRELLGVDVPDEENQTNEEVLFVLRYLGLDEPGPESEKPV